MEEKKQKKGFGKKVLTVLGIVAVATAAIFAEKKFQLADKMTSATKNLTATLKNKLQARPQVNTNVPEVDAQMRSNDQRKNNYQRYNS